MPGFKEIMRWAYLYVEKSGNSVIMVEDYLKRMRNYDDDF